MSNHLKIIAPLTKLVPLSRKLTLKQFNGLSQYSREYLNAYKSSYGSIFSHYPNNRKKTYLHMFSVYVSGYYGELESYVILDSNYDLIKGSNWGFGWTDGLKIDLSDIGPAETINTSSEIEQTILNVDIK